MKSTQDFTRKLRLGGAIAWLLSYCMQGKRQEGINWSEIFYEWLKTRFLGIRKKKLFVFEVNWVNFDLEPSSLANEIIRNFSDETKVEITN